jgi:hypothetical protein
MPRLQNMVIDKLGCPDEPSMIAKEDGKGSLRAAAELIHFVDGIPGQGSPLKRYYVRLLLAPFAADKICRFTAEQGKLHQFPARFTMEEILGNGLGTDLVTSLMALFGDLDVGLSAWNPKGFYVEESI